MTEGPAEDGKQQRSPRHTPEEVEAFHERIRLLEGYADLAEESVDERVVEHIREVSLDGSLDERRQVDYLVWHHWYLIPIFVVIAVLLALIIFYFGSGEDMTSSLDGGVEAAASVETAGADEETDAIENWVAENLEEASSGASTSASVRQDSTSDQPAAGAGGAATQSTEQVSSDVPGHFVGVIVSDNGWFRIVVDADGSVSGTLDVAMEVEGGDVMQTGSFVGTIDEENRITCAGRYQGISVDGDGREFPHEGSVTVTAGPTPDGLTHWEISADGEPGDLVVLPAHAE